MDPKTNHSQATTCQLNSLNVKWSFNSFFGNMMSGSPAKPRPREEILTSLIF